MTHAIFPRLIEHYCIKVLEFLNIICICNFWEPPCSFWLLNKDWVIPKIKVKIRLQWNSTFGLYQDINLWYINIVVKLLMGMKPLIHLISLFDYNQFINFTMQVCSFEDKRQRKYFFLLNHSYLYHQKQGHHLQNVRILQSFILKMDQRVWQLSFSIIYYNS